MVIPDGHTSEVFEITDLYQDDKGPLYWTLLKYDGSGLYFRYRVQGNTYVYQRGFNERL